MSTQKVATASRLAELASYWGLRGHAALAERIGISRSYATELLNGSKGLGGQTLVALATNGVNLNWLLTGEGPMLRGEPLDVAGLREELTLQIERWKTEAETHQRAVASLEKVLDQERELSRILATTNQQAQAGRVAESEATAYQVDRLRSLEAETVELKERLKKLGQAENATQVKEK